MDHQVVSGCGLRKLARLGHSPIGLVTQVADGLCSIQLEPVGAHPPGHIIDVTRDVVLKLRPCRRTTELVDLSVHCIHMRAVASQQCTTTGSVEGPTPVVRHAESALETKLTNQFERPTANQIRLEPMTYQTSYAIRVLQSLEKNVVVHRVKSYR